MRGGPSQPPPPFRPPPPSDPPPPSPPSNTSLPPGPLSGGRRPGLISGARHPQPAPLAPCPPCETAFPCPLAPQRRSTVLEGADARWVETRSHHPHGTAHPPPPPRGARPVHGPVAGKGVGRPRGVWRDTPGVKSPQRGRAAGHAAERYRRLGFGFTVMPLRRKRGADAPPHKSGGAIRTLTPPPPLFFYYGIHSLMFGGYPPTAIGYTPTAIGYTPTAISYPPAAIVGRIGHSEFFVFFHHGTPLGPSPGPRGIGLPSGADGRGKDPPSTLRVTFPPPSRVTGQHRG